MLRRTINILIGFISLFILIIISGFAYKLLEPVKFSDDFIFSEIIAGGICFLIPLVVSITLITFVAYLIISYIIGKPTVFWDDGDDECFED